MSEIMDRAIASALAEADFNREVEARFQTFKRDIASGKATLHPGATEDDLMKGAIEFVRLRRSIAADIDNAVIDALSTQNTEEK